MKAGLCCLLVLTVAATMAWAQEKPIDVPISSDGKSPFRLVGKLHEPLGTVLTVQGVLVRNSSRSTEWVPIFLVQRINSRATQEQIQIPLSEQSALLSGRDGFPELIEGNSYEFQAFESGAYVGLPDEARGTGWRSTSGFHFRHELEAFKGKRIAPVVFAPADFVNRSATLRGRAVSLNNKAYIQSTDEADLMGQSRPEKWRLQVDAKVPWPAAIAGKIVEATGVVRKADGHGEYSQENSLTFLPQLEGQVGCRISLRGGTLDNRAWWFRNPRGGLPAENTDDVPTRARNRSANPMSDSLLQNALPAPLTTDGPVFEQESIISPVGQPSSRHINAPKPLENK